MACILAGGVHVHTPTTAYLSFSNTHGLNFKYSMSQLRSMYHVVSGLMSHAWGGILLSDVSPSEFILRKISPALMGLKKQTGKFRYIKEI
jgi:hypothetical protein